MPNYIAEKVGFFDGKRIKPGESFYSEKKIEGKWFSLDKDNKSKPAPTKKNIKTGPAVAEGAEGEVGTNQKAATSSDVKIV